MVETINMRGDVLIRLRNKETGEIKEVPYQNLIVKLGKNLLARLIAGDPTALKIDKIGFGTNGAATAIDQTGLGGEIVKKNTTNQSFAIGNSAYNQAKFVTTLLDNEYNSQTYKELGLFSGNTMFSRLVIGDIAKTTAYEIDVEWTISFQ